MAALGATLGLAPEANGQCQYEVTAIIQAPPCPFTGPPMTFALGLSNNGMVVGRYEICGTAFNEAFIWTPNADGEGGVFKTLARPDGVLSANASGVNSAGFVIGGHLVSGAGWKGFIFDPNTQEYTYLDPLHPDIWPQTASTVNAINANNVVAGSRVISAPGEPLVTNAVIWHPYGVNGDGREVVVDLGDFGVGPNSGARDLNDDVSSVVGWTGVSTFSTPQFGFVLDSQANYMLVDETFGFSGSTAASTTNTQRTVGSGSNSQGNRAFVLDRNGLFVIEPLPGWPSSNGAGANDLGQVLINSWSPGTFIPCLWQHGSLMELALHTTLPQGLTLGRGSAINNKGQILTSATMNGKTVGAMLIPINRPVADLNADCKVDVHDLLMLLGAWGPCSPNDCPADLTGTGSVGVPDLLILLSNWG